MGAGRVLVLRPWRILAGSFCPLTQSVLCWHPWKDVRLVGINLQLKLYQIYLLWLLFLYLVTNQKETNKNYSQLEFPPLYFILWVMSFFLVFCFCHSLLRQIGAPVYQFYCAGSSLNGNAQAVIAFRNGQRTGKPDLVWASWTLGGPKPIPELNPWALNPAWTEPVQTTMEWCWMPPLVHLTPPTSDASVTHTHTPRTQTISGWHWMPSQLHLCYLEVTRAYPRCAHITSR